MEVIIINWIIFVTISWLVVGFIGMIYTHLCDLRGKEFDENYFDKECIELSIIMIFLGYFMPIILFIIWCKDYKPFTKLLYSIANIGTNKKE